jgi:dTDP-4-dehydrorhamnose reductase
MRVLILGGAGMLGYKLWQVCAERFDTTVTLRRPAGPWADHPSFAPARVLQVAAVEEEDRLAAVIAASRPQAVVNCIGVVKQRPAARDPLTSIAVNALFPHRLARLCRAAGARLIHLSTDCVFSGRRGGYREDDPADPVDLYGRSKLLGEVAGDGCLTLRTSMIGRELGPGVGLVEWFLRQQGRRAPGYTRAVFSGLTTRLLAETIADIIARREDLDGLWHVAAAPISKFALLDLIRQVYGLAIDLAPDAALVCDRSLDGDRFRAATGFAPPDWPAMIEAMRQDSTPYEEWQTHHAG